ncbi:MAG: mms16 [Rhodospirillales bacterium]|jgi:phasin family protein|nr:mms16 [Rhodospirillales bacterium]
MAKLPNPFDTDVTKLMAEFKLPGVDMETVLATQRKNIEALTKANQLAIEGLQTVARRQAEILRAGFEEASALARDLFQTKSSSEDRVAKQTEATKTALEKAFSNARELSEIVGKAQQEAFEIINKRMTESLDEVRDLVKKKGK